MRERIRPARRGAAHAAALVGRAAGAGEDAERVQPRDLVADALVQPVAHLGIGALERGGEREAVGRAVALHHDAAQAQQRGAVVAAVVEAAAEAP